jgi:hypothetical protein
VAHYRYDLAVGLLADLNDGCADAVERSLRAASRRDRYETPVVSKDPNAWMLTLRHSHDMTRVAVREQDKLRRSLIARSGRAAHCDADDQAHEPEQREHRDLAAHVVLLGWDHHLCVGILPHVTAAGIECD